METEVRLPQFGMGMSEAEVMQWYAADGDRVEEGTDLVEVEAEKAREVLAAPASGTLRIAAQPGDVVEVRTVLGVIVGDTP
ncbi:lipoyl domain-containing protein [Solwaraspora sp. WMMD792]|uniref:lipoyl domain-containing protein n=1 Tax=Solwaraspora sp. WMMD792 TaxID=3016099 RepID=UPI0024171F1E|nr:lipoyl domain-containing protein [Solwaraspora sp. WMMD792]MDG4771051.1 lipoyl domain-containing protein [Solwaraspora sp. WMMD792]